MTFISGDFSLALYMHFFFFLLLQTLFLSKIFNNKLKNGGARTAPLENMLLPIHGPTTTKDICKKLRHAGIQRPTTAPSQPSQNAQQQLSVR